MRRAASAVYTLYTATIQRRIPGTQDRIGILERVSRLSIVLLMCWLVSMPAAAAQTRSRKPPAKPKAPTLTTAAAELKCPALLGRGADTRADFCDVLTGRNPAEGIVVTIPPHVGATFLSFDLHNRHTYSEDEVRAKRAYAAYTAVIGVLLMDGTLVQRAAVQGEFFTAADLYDRIEGGAGPRGVKAVAPLGVEHVRVELPATADQVSILGEKLDVTRRDMHATYALPGTPIATISNVRVEFKPKAAPKKTTKKPVRRKQ